MRILAIDTSGAKGAVALVSDDRLVAAADLGAAGGHAERILGEIERLLQEQVLRPADLDLLAVTVGPGSFTGLRIGMAVAQGFAFGVGRPVVGVPSHRLLAAWARQVTEGEGSFYVPLIDARRGEVYYAAYRGGTDGIEEMIPPGAAAPGDLWPALGVLLEGGGRIVLSGDGIPVAAAEIALWPGSVTTVFPPMAADAALVTARLGAEEYRRHGAPAMLEPIYIRPADARKPARPPGARRRVGAGSGEGPTGS